MPELRKFVVVDTSVVFVAPQPFEIEEIAALGACDLVVPYTVLYELDILMSRVDSRERARSALRVLKTFGERGAFQEAVSCGSRMTLHVQGSDFRVTHPELDLSLADDRIIASALGLVGDAHPDVFVATTEFAMFAKASALGLKGLFIERLADQRTEISRREKAALRTAWRRLENVETPWAFCRRAQAFLNLPIARQLLRPVVSSGQPPELAATLQRFERLNSEWVSDVDLGTLLEPIFGLIPPRAVNYGVQQITEYRSRQPQHAFEFSPPAVRSESDEERSLRIRAEQRRERERNSYIVDVLLSQVSTAREYITDVVGDELFLD